MASQTTKLSISPREPEGSRATRRLRRSGRVPGILYGGDAEPLTFSADARELRHALAASGAVLEVSDGGSATPAILKSAQYHPVRGETMHVDLLRVDLSVAMRPEGGPVLTTMLEMFDLADAFCRSERLLSLQRTASQRQFHRWMLNEFINQLRGAPATPWPRSPGVELPSRAS